MPSMTENLMGTGITLSDKDICADMLKDSKCTIESVVRAAAESTNPQIRQLLSRQITNCLQNHYQLSDLAIRKNWYPAYQDPQQQMQMGMKESQKLV